MSHTQLSQSLEGLSIPPGRESTRQFYHFEVLPCHTNQAILPDTSFTDAYMAPEVVDRYIQYKESEGRSRGQIVFINSLLKRLCKFPVRQWPEKVLELQRNDGKPYEGETRKKHWELANAFLRWCMYRKVISRNPFTSEKPRFRIKDRPARPLSTQLIAEMLKKAEGMKINHGRGKFSDLLKFMLCTGLRTREHFNLSPADIDLEHRVVHVRKTKTNKARVVFLSATAYEICQGWMKERITGHPRFWCLNQRNFYLKFKKLHLSIEPYQTRHTYGTNLTRNKVSLLHVMRVMGQKTLKAALSYQEVVSADLEYIGDIDAPLA